MIGMQGWSVHRLILNTSRSIWSLCTQIRMTPSLIWKAPDGTCIGMKRKETHEVRDDAWRWAGGSAGSRVNQVATLLGSRSSPLPGFSKQNNACAGATDPQESPKMEAHHLPLPKKTLTEFPTSLPHISIFLGVRPRGPLRSSLWLISMPITLLGPLSTAWSPATTPHTPDQRRWTRHKITQPPPHQHDTHRRRH